MTVAGLLLAAGGGSRLGRPKAMVEMDGRLLVDRGSQMLAAAGCAPVMVVLGADAAQVAASAELTGAVVVVNDDWPSGMGSSLRTGLRALADHDVDAVVIALVDQPRVTQHVVRRLIDARDKTSAVVASYGGNNRNPVLLARSVWDEVCALAVGDIGARAWLQAHPHDVRSVACDDLGSDVDIDSPSDLMRLVDDDELKGSL